MFELPDRFAKRATDLRQFVAAEEEKRNHQDDH
jgi:hypothetical protein